MASSDDSQDSMFAASLVNVFVHTCESLTIGITAAVLFELAPNTIWLETLAAPTA